MKNKALLVGINKYPDPRNELRGCLNDILDMENYIAVSNEIYLQENIKKLTDKQATKKGILDHLKWLLEDVQTGDQILFHYSGHGAQSPTLFPAIEPDGQDEIICPYDFDWSANTTLKDKEFAAIFKQIPKGVHFVWISDSCHAEDLSRDPISLLDTNNFQATQYRNFIGQHSGNRLELSQNADLESVNPNNVQPLNGVLLSACQSHQLSADAYIDRRFNGAFTHYLIKNLKVHPLNTPLQKIINQVHKDLDKNGFDQIPQYEGLLVNASFFI